MNKMLTVIVPTYNSEKYLRQCLTSLHCQSYENLEFICINDGSTDGTAEILLDFVEKDKRFRVITTENCGYGAACNTGLDNATGEYITFLESDDFCQSGYYSAMMDIAVRYNCDLVKSDYYKYYSINRREYVRTFPKNAYNRVLAPITLLDKFNIYGTAPSIWSAVYHRELLDGIRFLETPGAAYQDTSFAVKVLVSSKRAYFTKRAFVNYRQHSEQSVASAGNVFAICDEYAEIERFIPMDKHLLKAKYRRYMWNLSRLDGDDKEQFAKIMEEGFEGVEN